MRKIALIALVFVALGAFAGGQAWGGIPPNSIRVDFFTCSSDCESQDVDLIQGGINCPAGQQYFFRVNLRQSGKTRAVGRSSGVCTGATLENWTTNQVRNPAALDCDSKAPIVSSGRGTVGGNPVTIDQQIQSCLD